MPKGVRKDRGSRGFNFDKGDVVRLRSGGPPMTIESFQEESISYDTSNYFATCVWYDSSGNMRRETFDERILEKVAR
jgi:uncharacterized protein YodC (DUF2158 family)